MAFLLLASLLQAAPAQAQEDVDAKPLELVSRVGNADPIVTAVEASKIAFSGGADAVLVASVEDFADALSAAGLAETDNAPLLFSNRDRMPQQTLDEIVRLGAERVILLGGSNAISDEAGQAIRNAGVADVSRAEGANRFATAAAVARTLNSRKSEDLHAYLALGSNPEPTRAWADAVGVSSLAGFTGRATLLTAPDRLPVETAEVIRELGYERITIIGGTAAISQGVAEEVQALGVFVDRLAGSNRYETSAAVTAALLEEGAKPGELWVASGGNFADPLIAGPAAAHLGGVMFLTDSPNFSNQPVRQFIVDNRDRIRAIRLAGSALDDGLLETIRALLDGMVVPDDAVLLQPGDDPQAVVDRSEPGTTFAFTPGTHRDVELVVRTGDTYLGLPGAILDGSRELPASAWRQERGLWVLDGIDIDLPTAGEYGCESWLDNEEQFALCGHEAEIYRSEQLFQGSSRLRHVNSLDGVERSGTWFYDVQGGRVWMYDNPADEVVRMSEISTAFAGFETEDVMISGLTIRRYGSAARTGVIDALDTRNWIIENVEVSQGHGYGIRIGVDTIIRDSRLLDNGQLGAGGSARESSVRIENNEVAFNGALGFQRNYEVGGVKVTHAHGVWMTNNYVHDNDAKGLWVDGLCRDVTINNNLVERQGQTGILYELSFGGEVRGNTLIDNHTTDDISDSYGNLQLVNAVDVDVYENTLSGGNRQEFTIYHTDLYPGVENIRVYDNDITFETTWNEGTYGVKDLRADQSVPLQGLVFENNRLRILELPERPFAWETQLVTLDDWLAVHPNEVVELRR
ncbi:cell wall-binding repeat-containing protein [Euzebya tangerina]|uniref:cell wall-binding repeat-containing protein n=1 Tax=Euzebya tangerina TaxID=591198 RepID=UPI0013C36FD3|nr:cell wall-binding repeat-containing protein [Euzebya tangerina]